MSFTEKRFEDFSLKKYTSSLGQTTIFLNFGGINHIFSFLDAVVRCGCEDTFPPLKYLENQSDENRFSLRDRYRLGNEPQWFPGFLSCSSRMFPERLRNKYELVGSEEFRQI